MEPDELLSRDVRRLIVMEHWGDQTIDAIWAMSDAEVAALPPLPFPADLFPKGTFPELIRFSSPTAAAAASSVAAVNVMQARPFPLWQRLRAQMRWLRRSHRPVRQGNTSVAAPPAASSAAIVRPTFTVSLKNLRLPAEDSNLPELHASAERGDLQALRRLLDVPGSDVDEVGDAGETALHTAIKADHARCAALLLERSANVNTISQCACRTECEGWRPIHAAAQSADPRMVALMLASGADAHAKTAIDVSALHVAAFHGRLSTVKLLVAEGVALDAADKHGYTPLGNARFQLLDCPCQPQDDPTRQWGACIAFLERLLSLGTFERQAAARHSWDLFVSDVLQEACEQPAPDEPRCVERDLAIHKCPGEEGQSTPFSHLLSCYRQSVDAKDHDGSTALHAAALAGRADAVRLLLENGAAVHTATNLSETALHLAAREGHADVVQLLLSHSAAAHALSRSGATPLSVARRRGHAAVVAILEGTAPSS